MPSGATHDRITLWSLPLVVLASYEHTRSSSLTLLVAGGYLFSGLMFGPDLDIHSRQYRRWGVFRWIWLPYRQAMRHRSILSHGPVIGTLLRLLYVSLWLCGLALLGVGLAAIAAEVTGLVPNGWAFNRQMLQEGQATIKTSLILHWQQSLALIIGMELGALSHILSDGVEWAGKRWKRGRATKKHRDRPIKTNTWHD